MCVCHPSRQQPGPKSRNKTAMGKHCATRTQLGPVVHGTGLICATKQSKAKLTLKGAEGRGLYTRMYNVDQKMCGLALENGPGYK